MHHDHEVLHVVSFLHHQEALELLLEFRANVNAKEPFSAKWGEEVQPSNMCNACISPVGMMGMKNVIDRI